MIRTALATIALAFGLIHAAWGADVPPTGLDLVCPLELHERARALEDARVEKTLTENKFRAQAKVFAMVEQLWAAKSIEQETYLDYERRRDRTKVQIARWAVQIEQDERALEQLALACGDIQGDDPADVADRVARLQAEVRRLDCELLAKDAEIADIDRTFDERVLAATSILVERNIKSRHDLVLDEYSLSQSKARSKSYRRRAKACRKQLREASATEKNGENDA